MHAVCVKTVEAEMCYSIQDRLMLYSDSGLVEEW